MEKKSRLETTLGDLIAAASEVAFEYSDSDREAYCLAQLALIEMLRKTTRSPDLTAELDMLSSPSSLFH